jgi:hypothetical protein
MVSTVSARDEQVEVLLDYYSTSRVFYEMSRTVNTVVLSMYRDIVGFVRIMVQNTEAVLTLFYVIRSVLYSNVHSCTYAILCILLVVLLLVRLIGPESKYSCPDPDRINIVVRTFTTRS